jgi:hypothetical protein
MVNNMITTEILRAVAYKYRTALETGEVPEQLEDGLCYAVSCEVSPIFDSKENDLAWIAVRHMINETRFNPPTEWSYLCTQNADITLHLRPRLEWIEAQIKRMEQEQIKETE